MGKHCGGLRQRAKGVRCLRPRLPPVAQALLLDASTSTTTIWHSILVHNPHITLRL